MSDLIERQMAIEALESIGSLDTEADKKYARSVFEALPSAESERLTDDDFETIRIHLNAIKEKLCNQRRWKEAEEYQRIIDRFMAFASVESNQKKGKWTDQDVFDVDENGGRIIEEWQSARCSVCGKYHTTPYMYYFDIYKFCPNCGARMV